MLLSSDLYLLTDESEIDESYYSTKYIFDENEFTGQRNFEKVELYDMSKYESGKNITLE
jgi:hypothetical protein